MFCHKFPEVVLRLNQPGMVCRFIGGSTDLEKRGVPRNVGFQGLNNGEAVFAILTFVQLYRAPKQNDPAGVIAVVNNEWLRSSS